MEQKIRTAVLGYAMELRKMKVGDIVAFPLPKYNYNSVRASCSCTLAAELVDGWKFKTKRDFDNKRVLVIRTA
ncbi:hypothetical protein [uncultured Duncaniella sp.]|jgi:hypothetical protein|uniref:hypothetical protein n=1 Tax=uncultured Duncaniella sp. TaxID=2768039 RepID=UPI0027301FF4|nr:hypothetical protein [uncultured Duncaniella sp.]